LEKSGHITKCGLPEFKHHQLEIKQFVQIDGNIIMFVILMKLAVVVLV